MSETFQPPHQGDEKTRRFSVLLVGQHPLVREGLLRLLEWDESLAVIAEAGSREEVLRAMQHFQPDLALIEMSLPAGFSIYATHTIRACSPATRVVVLILEGDEPYQAPLQTAGAAVVLHQGYGHELLIALRAAWFDETRRKLGCRSQSLLPNSW